MAKLWQTGRPGKRRPLDRQVLGRASMQYAIRDDPVAAPRTRPSGRSLLEPAQPELDSAIDGLGRAGRRLPGGALAVTSITSAPTGTNRPRSPRSCRADAPAGFARSRGLRASRPGRGRHLWSTPARHYASGKPEQYSLTSTRGPADDPGQRGGHTGVLDQSATRS